MSPPHPDLQVNPFLTVPIGRLFLSNALPMAVVMTMGGVLNVVDGIFVGHFIGSDALSAVGLSFPLVMTLSAFTTLIGGGMSSLMARHLGAGSRAAAGGVFAQAHGLAMTISIGLIALWMVGGSTLLDTMAAGNRDVSRLAQEYLRIIIFGAPTQLILGVHADTLRSEGRAGLIAALSVLINLFNIGANWLCIVELSLGITGSALGTVAAQGIGLAIVFGIRMHDNSLLLLSVLRVQRWWGAWSHIVRLGLPLCLSLIGIAVVAGVVIVSLRHLAGPEYAILVAAYGVVTRLLGFAFMPQMAFALATQSIAGHNVGAGRRDRARSVLRLAMGAAFLWCLFVALVGVFAGTAISGWFSDNPVVITAVAAILRPMLLLYAVSGPVLVLALYFQALGQPGQTAALTLLKPWVATPLLITVLSSAFGVSGIWMAFPIAEIINFGLAVLICRNAVVADALQAVHEEKRA